MEETRLRFFYAYDSDGIAWTTLSGNTIFGERSIFIMSTPVIWTRPDLSLPLPFDTLLFDVDGVLIETSNSFRAANIATTDYIVGTLNGLDWRQGVHGAAEHAVTMEDIGAFKRAGGFNSDWDMCYLLASLATARLREWHGTHLAERTTQEWADLAHSAALAGQGGRAWVEVLFPASARTAYEQVVDIFNEAYWGATELRQRFGRESRYFAQAEGFARNEEMLFAPDFFQRLRQAGIQRLGMITGRVGPEVESALERLEAYCGERWWDVVVPADHYAKPDPQALRFALSSVGAQGGLYIGDTADDFDLVRRYKQSREEHEPEVISAMVVHDDEIDLYRQRGADVLVESVEALLDFIAVHA